MIVFHFNVLWGEAFINALSEFGYKVTNKKTQSKEIFFHQQYDSMSYQTKGQSPYPL